jgi:hypothetical protein
MFAFIDLFFVYIMKASLKVLSSANQSTTSLDLGGKLNGDNSIVEPPSNTLSSLNLSNNKVRHVPYKVDLAAQLFIRIFNQFGLVGFESE